MPRFSADLVDPQGRREHRAGDAASIEVFTNDLRRSGFFVIRAAAQAEREVAGLRALRSGDAQLFEVTRALAALIPSGLPIVEALETAAGMADSWAREVLLSVRDRIQHGETLAGAFAGYPTFFPVHYCAMIGASEQVGAVGNAFRHLANQMERERKFREKMQAAAIYPALLTLASTVSVIALVAFVLPRFGALLQDTGARLPASARLALQFSAVARHNLPAALIVAGLALIAGIWTQTTSWGVRARHKLVRRLPLIGTMISERNTSRFARITSMLLAGGVPLSLTLDSVILATTDLVAREALVTVKTRVLNGQSFSDAIASASAFPALLARLTHLGERSGTLPQFLTQTAEYYEERLQVRASRLVALFEPAVILVFGFVVGTTALILLQTVYGLNTASFK